MLSRQPKAFFVTANDTDAGKTTITKQLILACQQQGYRTAGCKPIACGVNEAGSNDDAMVYQRINSVEIPYTLLNPICLKLPASPNIAAKLSNSPIEVARVVEHLQPLKQLDLDYLFYEGIGGWKVPLNDQETTIDLVKALNVPTILVIGIRVGCINHGLLTWEAIVNEGVAVAGWIANSLDPATPEIDEHIATLQHWIKAPYLGLLPNLDASIGTGFDKLDIDTLLNIHDKIKIN